MGCSQSKHVHATSARPAAATGVSSNSSVASTRNNSSGNTNSSKGSKQKRGSKKASSSSPPTSVPVTRARIDSWAQPTSNGAHNNSGKTMSSVENQWHTLWDSQATDLIDPADVHVVLDSLLDRTCNLLSTCETTLIQRKVRYILKALPSNQNTSKIGRVFSSSNVHETEAKTLATTTRLLNSFVVHRVFQAVPATSVDVIENAYILLLHLSETLWDRVQNVATHAAESAQLEMDVNKQTSSPRAMPKPSMVPDLETAPELPLGVTFQALVLIIALGLKGKRVQRLQLLFYLCLPTEQLESFLAHHPAGGVPCWLLEVGHATVISLASLTHYHYFGNAFLPKHVETDGFVASKSRSPIKIKSATVRKVIEDLLDPQTSPEATVSPSRRGSNSNQGDRSERSGVSLHGMLGPLPRPRRKSSAEANNNTSTHGNNGDHSNHDSTGLDSVTLESLTLERSDLMAKLYEVGETGHEVILDEAPPGKGSAEDLSGVEVPSISSLLEQEEWTLQDFAFWADQVLDNPKLHAVLHRIFGVGILPSHVTERDLVQTKWNSWSSSGNSNDGVPLLENTTNHSSHSDHSNESWDSVLRNKAIWGGLGNWDGAGGIGHGFLYCVEKRWWDEWVAYTGWSWQSEQSCPRRTLKRPGTLFNDALLDKDAGNSIPGILGSYELMSKGLRRDVDYVLVPPPVWDVLYEMYGGGPPLPRMVQADCPMLHRTVPNDSDGDQNTEVLDKSPNGTERKGLDHLHGLDRSSVSLCVPRLPNNLHVATHPWIIHCQLCDPLQPYRRGDAGPLSIRIMAIPEQPLWRLYVEIVLRFPLYSFKASGSDGRGKARLWRKHKPTNSKDPVSRYGPWNLLCKNRDAIVPNLAAGAHKKENTKELVENWQAYADNATVDSSGLCSDAFLMLEYAVVNKNNDLIWPREAAAKAGRVRRLAEEDRLFREALQGVDSDGNLVYKPQSLVDVEVDAMDSTGRWYPVTILQVDIVDEDTENEAEELEKETTAKKKVKVDFKDHGGHIEWIDVESDRLAKLGRFTSESEQLAAQTNGLIISSPNDVKPKAGAVIKKSSSMENMPESTKICPFPGYGACGLSNLGNTCYANSAIQCMSYLPLLRAYLLSSQYKTAGDLNRENFLGTGGKLLEEFAELLRSMWSAKLGEKSPVRFRSQLGKVNDQFSGADQQDAQEFLNYMLDVLHEDSNKVRQKPYVEALEDEWVTRNHLPRVGEEAWRRFLRRNRSIMADVAMGQVLNTVTCPQCNFSSRNFDPFNLLSIPIPTVADVTFQCTVYRRATAVNCPWVLNRTRKGDKRPARYPRKRSGSSTGPPSVTFVAERYMIAMSRLADSGDLRLQIQNMCGIPASQLKLCRSEEVLTDDKKYHSILQSQTKVIPLTDKEGPCSQLAKPRTSEDSADKPTHIVAFETTLQLSNVTATVNLESLEDTADEDEDEYNDDDIAPSPKEQKLIEKHLSVYGDAKECRVVDSDPWYLSRAVSRSLWPRSEKELKLGLRVDAKDQRGSWFAGTVVEVLKGDVDADIGEDVELPEKKVLVHFDHFSSKWDEVYSISNFKDRLVRPLFSHATPRGKPTEFLVQNRFTDHDTGRFVAFGQSFYVQCCSEWSNARAGAQIMAQASRFLHQMPGWGDASDVADSGTIDREAKARKLYERTHGAISDLIDLLVDCDREYLRLALGLSDHKSKDDDAKPYRNPTFDPTSLSMLLVKKVSALLHRIPFEVRVCTVDNSQPDKPNTISEEESFPFSLIRTVGNYMNARHVIILQWRDPPTDKKTPNSSSTSTGASYVNCPVLYVPPPIVEDQASADLVRSKVKADEQKAQVAGDGMDLGVCLTEFCKTQNLSLSDNWKCPRCKKFRQGQQNMNLWRLPDLLTFHLKRFNMSARWREKLTTKINFPLTGLDLRHWCHKESPAVQVDPMESSVYDLIGVVNHYGSMTGGHYVATCKATACTKDGKEETAYGFNGVNTSVLDGEGSEPNSGWRLGRQKNESNASKMAALEASKAVSESAEPLWLQFDDELVEPLAPEHVVSEMAYVLFYRRRRMTPSNVAKYSTLE